MKNRYTKIKGACEKITELSDDELLHTAGGFDPMDTLDNALQKVLKQQAAIEAERSCLDPTSSNLTAGIENLQPADSALCDPDLAKTMAEHVTEELLQQTQQAMLAQANQSTPNVLGLLK